MFKNYKSIKQVIKNKNYKLFIANTSYKKKKGLSGIDRIPQNIGMLFTYNKEEKDRSFTMKNVFFDLLIIFLDKNMNIVYQQNAKRNQIKPIICEKPSMYVIEIPC